MSRRIYVRQFVPLYELYLRMVKKRFNEYWKNHFSTIGIIGLNEACMNLFGEGVGSTKGKTFGEKILDFMREILIKYQKETGNNYNLEATPAEGTSYRLARLDMQKYPDIISASVVFIHHVVYKFEPAPGRLHRRHF